ncbi:hypothetical protein [Nonomuraea sp. KM90]|uniref:hypothetical protein n=1 Tax=Nonomuraea sp. KM90 TaxID=3457428 RepID=UPI003FCCF952
MSRLIVVCLDNRTEHVDLDQLTPRARAFAEAIHDCFGHQPLEIRFEGPPPSDKRQADFYGRAPRHSITRNWSPRPPEMTAVQWLEREIRTLPLDWYPVSALHGERVPSAEEGAADRVLTRETVLKYLREHGYPMSAQAWDTLRGTGHLPEPDRYVCSRPQWRPETLDAYIHRPRELWTVSQIASYLGYSGTTATSSARKQLSRWGFTAETRDAGRSGESRYAADQIIAAQKHRPGQGRRTDLHPKAADPPHVSPGGEERGASHWR